MYCPKAISIKVSKRCPVANVFDIDSSLLSFLARQLHVIKKSTTTGTNYMQQYRCNMKKASQKWQRLRQM